MKTSRVASNLLKLLQVPSNAELPCVEFSRLGEVRFVSPSFVALTQIDPEDILRKNVGASEMWKSLLVEVQKGTPSFVDDSILNAALSKNFSLALYYSAGRFFGFLTSKQTNRACTDSERESFLYAFLDQIPIPIWLRNPSNRKYEYINPAGVEHFRIPASKFVGKVPEDIFPPEIAESIAATENKINLRIQKSVSHIDVINFNNQPHTVSATKTFVTMPDQTERLLVVGDDVSRFNDLASETTAARKETERAGKAKSAFLAQMSHEIRSPLNGIIATAHLLKDTDLSDEQKRYVSILEDSGNHLLTLISNILDFSKIEAGKMTLEISAFNLTDLVETQIELFSAMARTKGLALLSFIDPTIPTQLLGDPSRLAQVLINLISNAIKFTKTGVVTVRADRLDMNDQRVSVKFSVIDTGKGISSATQKILFQPFAQGSRIGAGFGGTGLGLAISQSILALMHSTIVLKSSENTGSEFSFTIDFESMDQDTPAHDDSMRAKILVVDDCKDALEIIKAYLKTSRYICHNVHSVDAAIAELKKAHLENKPYDLVLTEKNIATKTGYDLLEAVKRSSELNHLKTVLISGDRNANDSLQARKAGFDAFLSKPFKRFQLISVLHRLIDGTEIDTSSAVLAEELRIRKPRVLIADDMAVNRTVVLALLNKLGCTAQAVASGREAVAALETGYFDVVLMDCQMPDLDGYAATTLIRALPDRKKAHVPIIALTASATKEDELLCLTRGMNGFISKPIHPDALLAAIAEQVL